MIKRIGIMGITLTAVLALSGLAVSSASAAEPTKILPEPTIEKPLTAEVLQPAEGHLLTVGGFEVVCKSGSGEESWTSANIGTAVEKFEKCTGPLSTTCSTEGGQIVAKGEVRFWLALLMTGTRENPTSELVGALVFLLAEPGIKFICVNKTKTLEDSTVVRGCVAAQVLPASLNRLIVEAKEEFAEWSTGQTKILSVLPQETTSERECLPKTSTNGGAEEL